MKSIYICHDKTDKLHANQIKNMFEMENIECQDLHQADVHLFIFSDSANRSKKVLDELQKIISLDKKFLTLQYTNHAPSDELSFYICATQWMDMKKDQALKHLLNKVLRQIR